MESPYIINHSMHFSFLFYKKTDTFVFRNKYMNPNTEKIMHT